MFKILLLNPPWYSESGYGVRSNSRWPHTRKDKVLPFPIYMAYTAVVLEKEGFTVDFVDAVAEDFDEQKVAEIVQKNSYGLVIVETSTPSIENDLSMVQKIKENSSAKVALIGAHSTYFSKDLLDSYGYIDYILRGEFEYTILDLCKCLRDGEKVENIKGLSFRKEGEVVENPDRPLISDLDKLPFPAWHLFNMKYYDPHLYKSPSVLMISSRGCPYRCTYCLWPQVMYGHKLRTRSAENVVDEIEILKDKYRVKAIEFDDDTFTIGKRRVVSICNEIIKRGIKISWSCFGRVDVDREMLSAMKEAGCEFIKYGVESGSQKILDRCKKQITLNQVREAFRITKEVGIKDYGTFMFGLSGENWDTVNETIEFAIELDPYAVQFSIVTPLPGTEYYSQLKSKGLLKAKNWRDFDGAAKAVIVTAEMSKEDLERAFALAWKKFYLRPSYILKTLIRYSSSFQDLKRLIRGTGSFFRRYLYYRGMLQQTE